MKWQNKLALFVVVVGLGAYLWGYMVVRSSKYIWARSRHSGPAEPGQDRTTKILYVPMEVVEKLTKDTPVDVEVWANWYEKKMNPDGPAISVEEVKQRFVAAHHEGSMEKIRALFYKRSLHDDDARQIAHFFEQEIVSVSSADLPRESIAHSQFEDDLVVTRMLVVEYSMHHSLFPSTARFYIGRKDGRYFLVLRFRNV